LRFYKNLLTEKVFRLSVFQYTVECLKSVFFTLLSYNFDPS